MNLHVVEIDNVIKGVVPAIPVSNRTASNVALTIDRISAFKNHWVPSNKVARAADIVTQLQDTPKVISVLESLEIYRYVIKTKAWDENLLDNMGKFPTPLGLRSN